MKEIFKQKSERKSAISSTLNKKIFDGIVNSDFSNFIKTNNLKFNSEKIKKIRKNKKIENKRKELTSAPFIKKYSLDKLPNDYYNFIFIKST